MKKITITIKFEREVSEADLKHLIELNEDGDYSGIDEFIDFYDPTYFEINGGNNK